MGAIFLTACGGGGGSSTQTSAPTQSEVEDWQSPRAVTSGINTRNTIKGLVLISPTQSFYSKKYQ
jgi:hypothetical protein